MADRVVVTVGTKRGLFLLESNARRKDWKVEGPYLKGWQIYHAVLDARGTPRVHAAGSSEVFGSSAFSSGRKKIKFEGAKRPPKAPDLLPKALKVAKKYGCNTSKRLWHIEPGRASERGVLYAGTAPAGLFRSEDDGRTWQSVEGLLRHPSRKDWMVGYGGMCLHSIQLDPRDEKRMIVAISAAGSFRTEDGGKTWKPINKAVSKFKGAPKNEQVGTCVHKLLMHPAKPGRVYQQNHVGVYQSDDYGDTWQPIHAGLPFDFGFGLALNPADPDACYVVPLDPEGYTFRATPGAMKVYRWNAKKKTWTALERGLPGDGACVSVLREGMANDTLDPCGVYVGTGSGTVFQSADAGRSWKAAAMHLPPVLSVSAAVV
ncbi:MAG: exo-alpha-sialidase [Planctomycetota bacterium]|nr:exo-alpha-sialidase [Planctomycetota bacterium]